MTKRVLTTAALVGFGALPSGLSAQQTQSQPFARLDSVRVALEASAIRSAGAVAAAQPGARKRTWFDEDRTFSLLDENDAFASSDSSYTQGLRLAWEFGAWPDWLDPVFNTLTQRRLFGKLAPGFPTRPCEARMVASERPKSGCGTVRITLGQTMYTPPNISVDTLITTSRPYSGYLFTSFGAAALYKRMMVTSEVTVGLLGPGAGAAATQSVAHWTWSWTSERPLGWHHQLRNSPQITIRNTYTGSLLQYCWRGCNGTIKEGRIFDLLPTGEVVAGTLMTRVSLGGTARLGWRFPDLVTAERIGTTKEGPGAGAARRGDRLKNALRDTERFIRTRTWVMGFAGHDQRAVLHNALLSGSFGDRGDGRWRDVSAIETRHGVGETYLGFAGGLARLSVAWQRITRSAEYTPNGGKHRFGSFTVTLTSPVR